MTATLEQLRSIYDEDQRRTISFPDAKREETPNVIRLIDQYGTRSAVIYAQLTADKADAVIAGEVEYFARLGHTLEWKYFSHDAPPDLLERLIQQGFEAGDEEAILMMALDDLPESLLNTGTHTIRRVTGDAGISDVIAVEEAVWGEDYTEMGKRLKREQQEYPDELSIYVAYADEKPVSCAWLRFAPGSQFGSLWGGSTLAEYRGRGVYRALLAIRAQEARQRGVRYLTVDASPMSRPILERLGFQWISLSRECIKTPPGQ